MKISILSLTGFLLAFSVNAQVKMPGIFGDHMVIQRTRPVPVWGWSIAGSDHHFYFAKALMQNNKVIVYADEVSKPESVRFAWADDAGDANLYNSEGFPAVPFRTDQWKGVTDDIKYSIGK
jgi:hypothetical protein